MKSVLNIAELNANKDVIKIKNVIADNQGILACKINKDTKTVEIIYDDYFISCDKIIDCIENLGYTVV